MKVSPTLRIALLAVLPWIAAFSVSLRAEPGRPYLVIPETTSPNRRYAVVWTLPKGSEIEWEKFRNGARGSDYLPDFEKPENEIADDLVELASGRKLAAVASGYWALPEPGAGPRFRPDDEFLEVAWSKQSDFVLVLNRLRSGPDRGSLLTYLKNGSLGASWAGPPFELPWVYLVWLAVVLLLYLPCRWFADLKRRRRDVWLTYL